MGAGNAARQILPDTVEGQGQSGPAADQNIIMPGLEACAFRKPHRFAQAPPDAVALDGIADLPGDGKADSGRVVVFLTVGFLTVGFLTVGFLTVGFLAVGFLALAGLQDEAGRGDRDAARRGQEIRPFSQSLH